MRYKPVTQRLEDNSCPEALTGCILWMKHLNKGGYGVIRVGRKTQLAYKVAYETLVGPVPQGLELDHKCRNRACINVDHLEPVTHQENVRRGIGLAAINAKKTHCIRGHELVGRNLRVARNGKRSCRTCYNAAQAIIRVENRPVKGMTRQDYMHQWYVNKRTSLNLTNSNY